jgi:hypothetical protein
MIFSVTTGHLPEIDTKSLRADLVNELQSGASFGTIGPVIALAVLITSAALKPRAGEPD